LEKIDKDYGDELLVFQNDMETVTALELFDKELKEGVNAKLEEKLDTDAVVTGTIDWDTDKLDEGESEALGKNVNAAESEEQGNAEINDKKNTTVASSVCGSCGVTNVRKKFCGECGAKMTTTDVTAGCEKITEAPVWIVITLKKPLQKFVSNTSTTLFSNEVLEMASMIILEYNPDNEPKLKSLNRLLEGPWKDIRKKHEELLKGKSAYTLKKTLQYLVKIHTRQEVLDNILVECKLCEKNIKGFSMKRHIKLQCMNREEPCEYCNTIFVFKLMEEHHSGCSKFPVPCPLHCGDNQIQRCLLEEHSATCKNVIVDCEFKEVGCTEKMKRREVHRHMSYNEMEHLKLVKIRMLFISKYIEGNNPAFSLILNPSKSPATEDLGEDTIDMNCKIDA